MAVKAGSGVDFDCLERPFETASVPRIPYNRGFLDHSDGDVLVHALCDAVLGAAALGDIGRRFPDSDPQYQGMDSRVFLRAIRAELAEGGWRVGNVDTTLIAQAPRMAPYIGMMRTNLAADLGLEVDQVSVKATTTERLGFTGREEGVAASAIALIETG